MTKPSLSPGLPSAEAGTADLTAAGSLAVPVPVRWMPALFRHTRVDARLYQPAVLAMACAERLHAHGGDAEAWTAAVQQLPAEAWALATALESACWRLPEVVDLDVSAAVAAWRQGRPRGASSAGTGARVWLPACPDTALALRLNIWLAAAQPPLPWLVTRSPDPDGRPVGPSSPASADIAWRAHRVLHEPMAGRFDLIIAPALLGVCAAEPGSS